MVKNPPSKAGNKGSIPGPGRSPHTVGQLRPCATSTEATHSRPCALQAEKACTLQWRPTTTFIYIQIHIHTHQIYPIQFDKFKCTQSKFCSLTDLVAAAGPKKISKGFGDNKKHREKHTPSGFTLSLTVSGAMVNLTLHSELCSFCIKLSHLIGFPAQGLAGQLEVAESSTWDPVASHGSVCNSPCVCHLFPQF